MFLRKTPSIWLGQGFIHMRSIAEPVRYFTRWTIADEITQEVEIDGLAIKQVTVYTISPDLKITLENEDLGLWEGVGIIDEHHFSWRLSSNDKSLTSEEHFYHLENGRIKTRAIFSDSDGPYTVVEGELWQKMAQSLN